MTTESASSAHYNLDLAELEAGQQARLVTAEGTNWSIQRDNRVGPKGKMISGFSVQSGDPTWTQRQGTEFSALHSIERYIAEGCLYHIGGFELLIAEIHSVHRREI